MGTYNEKIATNPKVELIHVSRDQDKESAEEWAKKEKFPWPTVLPDNFERCGLSAFAGNGVPHYVLLDKDGNKLAEGLQAALAKAEGLSGAKDAKQQP